MNPEGSKNIDDLTKPKNTIGNSFSSVLFYLSILFFIIGFNFSDIMVGNWYQQFMPSSSGGQIRDIYFVDSLLGFAVSDSSILKTINGGDNWAVKLNGFNNFKRITFLNAVTGFACAGNNRLYKTTNSGENWTFIVPSGIFPLDMSVLSIDTIWLVNNNSLVGGVFRTINGGINWDRQLDLGSQNPTNIYFYDKDTGYVAENVLYKTTNSGVNWVQLPTGGGFSDMYFVNALTGWKCSGSMKKTTDGGLNWVTQVLPSGVGISALFPTKFSNISTDTIWLGGGRIIFPNSQARGMLFRTTNQGSNWLYQIPDTAIVAGVYSNVKFLSSYIGWAYSGASGIHTTNGGDTTFVLVHQISIEVPKEFKLFQNYPNPFNPNTKIKYQIINNKYQNKSNVKLIVFDITGKEIISLVNGEQSAGTYEVDFIGSGYSSGIYFYSLIIDGITVDTKKMLMIK